ncbi:BON domain-containing protein [Leeia oryzae]|uniref:BON domain-containing protein n=1 Tax=Leeia oryzae TaxID=356662 RepID=UPI0003746281|nr:BON domain-containing protein [Leeia oryzae]
MIQRTDFSAKTLAVVLLASLSVPLLSGCLPVVATGVAVGAMSATDRRTTGAQLEDEGIEDKAETRISGKFGSKVVHANVISFNRQVLITGEAADAATRQEVERIVKGVPNVRYVFNELAISPVSSLSSRANDSYITSKVKARMVDSKKFSANHVKTVTENGVVYLMGLVKHQEALDAVEVARTTSGVKKVVTGYFEYID